MAGDPEEAIESAPFALGYQPGLDGLRGVAVAGVLLYHHVGDGSRLGRGGRLGVDVFFVLSGFLITSILLAEHQARGRIAFGRFWSRRARRLFPALLAGLGLAIVLGYLVFTPRDQTLLRDDVIYSLTYLQNWHVVFWGGAIDSPFSHAWSLSVEEQFYLVWPLALVGLLVLFRNRPRRLAPAILGLAIAAAGWTAYRYSVARGLAYFGTDTRAQELFLGAALAALLARRRSPLSARAARVVDRLGLGVLVLLLVALLAADPDPLWFRGGFFVFGVAVTLVIAAAIQPGGRVRRVLGVRPLVAIGLVSYGLYLYHFPIYRWLNADRLGIDGVALLVVRLGVTGGAAFVSYRFLEQPVRHGRGSARVLVPAAVVSVAVLLVSTAGLADVPVRPESDLLAYVLPELASTTPAGVDRVVFLGGTEAAYLAVAADGVVRRGNIAGLALGTSGCGFSTDSSRCRALPDDLGSIARAFGAQGIVVLLAAEDLQGADAPARVVARLDAARRSTGGRVFVVVLPPCPPTPSAATATVARAVRSWSERTGVRLEGARDGDCDSARPGTLGQWVTRLEPELAR